MNWKIGVDIDTPLILCIQQVTNEKLLYSTGNYSVLHSDLSGKEIQKRGAICVHTADSLCCGVET